MTVLQDIIAGVREDLDARMRTVPLAELKGRAAAAPPALDAFAALAGDTGALPELRVIAEVKRRSPSKGELAGIADPAALAGRYADGGASVISVLTEERRFGGSLADLDAVRAAVRIPVLRKDFTCDPYMIWEARAHGADLVLLIVAALNDGELRDYLALARELGMNAIVETHTAEEIERAVAVGAQIIGINVRNLKTLEVDRGHFAALAGNIPAGPVVIAESGVRDAQDVRHYAGHGAQAILVGEALVRDAAPLERITEFKQAGTAAMQALHQDAR
ncbi:indole-3-glycerol phosphate synthase TrpC [Arthrobacter sp.]|uniref:indole-3-glycerol phosphate synthase TrpC n=1 Tax=Arthrobacter sp. TaxID=1667 RepID=UPI002589D5F5|nr:indole-3-glycerol phosphate synthase TrpC [Arthrobacter sp.]